MIYGLDSKYFEVSYELDSAPKMNIITEGKLKAGREFIKLAAKYGAKLVRSKKHNVFRDAAGHQITAPKTTSDFRAIKNFESELKGRGFVKQETAAKVKDALVKGSKVTAIPSRRTANQQTTFKDFTQKFQPNVQGPRKPNTTKGEIRKRELEGRMDRGYRQSIKDLPADVKFDLANKVLRDIRRSLPEAMTPEEKKNAKLKYQYDQRNNPQPIKPLDVLKSKKGLA